MADLLDIAPATAAVESVRIGDLSIKVHGVSVNTLASLVSRFPDLKSVAIGGDGGDIVARLISGFGVATGPIIAAGCGHLEDEEYEKRAASLLAQDQVKLLGAIIRLSFPNGFGSFVEALTNLFNPANERAKPRVVKIRWKQSPTTSSPSPDMPDSIPTIQ